MQLWMLGVGPQSTRAALEKKFQPGAREGELESHLWWLTSRGYGTQLFGQTVV